tara:strand:- start:304 stop:486 length:183 start_codon:yes stop_codon:yes gene_type:complete
MSKKQYPLIADYVPVLQMVLEKYHLGDHKTQKVAMELMRDIGLFLNEHRDKEMGKKEDTK